MTSSNRAWDGLGEQYYKCPAGQRNFEFSGFKDAKSEAFTVVSKDNQELTITGGLTFHLDTSCDDGGGALRSFLPLPPGGTVEAPAPAPAASWIARRAGLTP